MSRRRHGVWSDGKKFKGLISKHEMEYERERRNRDTPVEWDYLSYFKAYTHLLLQKPYVTQAHPSTRRGLLSEVFREEEAVQDSMTTREPEPPFEGMIFDLSRSGALPSKRLTTGIQMESLHLDSGFYISVPEDIAVVRPQGDGKQRKAGQMEEGEACQDESASGRSTWAFTVQHGEAGSCRVEAPSNGTVGDLQPDVYNLCGVPPCEQRFLMEGLPLPWEIELSCVGEGTTLQVVSGKEEESKLVFTVQYGGGNCREFEVQEHDTVGDLMNDIAKWRGAPPSEL